jgi:hypothetical protein
MKAIFRGVLLETVRCAAVTVVRTLRKIPAGQKG